MTFSHSLRCGLLSIAPPALNECEALARLAGTRLGQQRVVKIFPKLLMLPQVNDGGRLLAAFIHHESDSAHGNNLAEKNA
jgi:hypothetical protein